MKNLKSKLVAFALAICLIISCMPMLIACGDHIHALTKVDAVAETCSTAGNKLYYKCDCGKYFSDKEAKTEIEKDSWIISATGHSYASTWTYDETHHWKEATCSHSTEKSDYAEHSFANNQCVCGYSATTYTVTEEEWRINFNLTKGQTQTQQLSCANKGQASIQLFAHALSQKLTEITSYTIYADGVNEGVAGTCLLKVSPNAMSIEFRLAGALREDESGIFASTTDFYKGLTASIMSYFPFADHYDDFSFDQAKNAYVAQNLKSTVVDEEDITQTYDMYTKKAEVSFVNGYLNTIAVELCDETYENVYSSFVFTFSNMNSTTVEVEQYILDII